METLVNNSAAIIPLDPKDRVLLQRKDLGYLWGPGQWCLFGGKIEDGENLNGIDTLLRETKEEIGIFLEGVKLFGSFPYSNSIPSKKLIRRGNMLVYSGRFDGDLRKIKLGEGAGFSLYEEEEIYSLNMIPHDKDILLEFYKSIRNR